MRSKAFSFRNLIVPLALLAFFGLPFLARAIQAPVEAPGSAERIARMEEELQGMQDAAARNPSRPTLAQLEREMNQMIANRNADATRQIELSRTRRLMSLSFGLNLVLLAVLALALARRRRTPASLAG